MISKVLVREGIRRCLSCKEWMNISTCTGIYKEELCEHVRTCVGKRGVVRSLCRNSETNGGCKVRLLAICVKIQN